MIPEEPVEPLQIERETAALLERVARRLNLAYGTIEAPVVNGRVSYVRVHLTYLVGPTDPGGEETQG